MTKKNKKFRNPLAVGGVGGSGTRLVYDILITLNFYLGVVNATRDNMWFSLLMKRPKWLRQASKEDIEQGLRIFEKEMLSKYSHWNWTDLKFIWQAVLERTFNHYNYKYTKLQKVPLFLKIFPMLHSHYNPDIHRAWGWKEPNTHIYLNELSEYFDNLKYIHVIRHGMDMAYSENHNQLYLWSDRFNIDVSNNDEQQPVQFLEYWIKSNKKAIKTGEKKLDQQFYLLYFDRLCQNPKEEINKLLDFLEIDQQEVDLNKLYNLPYVPSSIGRYKKYNNGKFPRWMIQEVKNFGFEVEM